MERKKDDVFILYLEESQSIIKRVQDWLAREMDWSINWSFAQTKHAFLNSIKDNGFDIILSAYSLMEYGACEALHDVKLLCSNVPFIIISESIEADCAVELILEGASDCICLERLERLRNALTRSIHRQQEKQIERNKTFEILKKVIDNVPICILWLDQNLAIAGMNQKSAEFLQLQSVDSILGRNISSIFSKDLSQKHADFLPVDLQSMISGIELQYEFAEEAGKNKWVSLKKVPLTDVNGIVDGLLVMFEDITEQKETREEAQRTVEFERAILHFAQEFINMPIEQLDEAIVKAIRMVAQYCEADRTFVYLYEWEQDQATLVHEWHKDSQDYISKSKSNIPLLNISQILDLHKQGIVYLCSSFDVHDAQSLQGQIAEEVKAESSCAYPLITNGKLIGMFGCISMQKHMAWAESVFSIIKIFSEMLASVLGRKVNEIELMESQENYRLILDSSSDGIAMIGKDGRLLNLNETYAKRFNVQKKEVIGIKYADFLRKGLLDATFEKRFKSMKQLLDVRQPIVFEDTRDGMWFENKYYPIEHNGQVCAVTLFSTDITDRKKVEGEMRIRAEYQARFQVMTEFFTNVSHEFKTPLSVLLIQLELMKLYFDDEKKMQELINSATQNSYRLTRLVSNILDISKIEAGYMKPRYSNADIIAVVRDICECVSSYAEVKLIYLSFHSNIKSKLMLVDIEKTERILLNLLSNAIKHTSGGGQIKVDVKIPKEGGVQISVGDTGEGIPKNKQAVIFERFTQVDTSISRRNEGCGIGLALVKSLVELLGGSIQLKSKVGVGSRFLIELPDIPYEKRTEFFQMEGYSLNKKIAMELSDLYLRPNI